MNQKIEWTSAQKKAFQVLDRNVVVSAGAGSGKTTVLVERFLNLIENGIELPHILAVTFTDKAAGHMKQKIYRALRQRQQTGPQWKKAFEQIESLQVSTIHSFCSRVLKENALEAGVDPHFRLMDEVESWLVQEELLSQLFESYSQEESSSFDFFKMYSLPSLKEDLLKIYEQVRGSGNQWEMLQQSASWNAEQKIPALLDCIQALIDPFQHNSKITPPQKKWVGYLEELKVLFQSFPSIQWETLDDLRQLIKSARIKKDDSFKQTKVELLELIQSYLDWELEKKHHHILQIFRILLTRFDQLFQDYKKLHGVLDYEDLLIKTRDLLLGSDLFKESVHQKLAKQYQAIMIDEMQDTNPLQFQIFQSLKENGHSFYVGDLKQSIYRFRHADLNLFQNLIHQSQNQKQDSHVYIALKENFRSTSTVLSFVNDFFSRLWESMPDLHYEALETGVSNSLKEKPTWVLLDGASQELNRSELRQKEAAWVADQIQALVSSQAIQYGDVAILLRNTISAPYFETAFKAQAIPYQVVRSRTFFDQLEIQDLWSFVRLLNDPGDDLCAMSVLKSALFGLNDQILWEIRDRQLKSSFNFVEQVLNLEMGGMESNDEKEKLEKFQNFYTRVFHQTSHLKLSQILRSLLHETHYDQIQLGKHAGLQRYQNIQTFLKAIEKFESIQPVNLNQLVQYLEKLKNMERFENDAPLDHSDSGHVQILTIHKSKGLEFPVVFVVDLDTSKKRALSQNFIYHPEVGLGFKFFNNKEKLLKPLYSYQTIEKKEKQADVQELRRLFYVATTRAQKYLYLVSGFRSDQKVSENPHEQYSILNWLQDLYPQYQTLIDSDKTQLELPALKLENPALDEIKIRKTKETYHLVSAYQKQKNVTWVEAFPARKPTSIASQTLSATLYTLLPYCQRAFGLATTLKRQGYHFKKKSGSYFEDSQEIPMEEWVENDWHEGSNPFLGQLVHGLAARLSGQTSEQDWQVELEHFGSFFKTEGELEIFNTCLKNYRNSPYIHLKPSSARDVLREQDFMAQVGQHVLKGIIDLAYLENEEWILVDYKTTVVRSFEHQSWLKEYYFGQLQAYAYALEAATHKKVKRAELVFLYHWGDADKQKIEWTRPQLQLNQLTDHFINTGFGSNLEWNKKNCVHCHFKEFCL